MCVVARLSPATWATKSAGPAESASIAVTAIIAIPSLCAEGVEAINEVEHEIGIDGIAARIHAHLGSDGA